MLPDWDINKTIKTRTETNKQFVNVLNRSVGVLGVELQNAAAGGFFFGSETFSLFRYDFRRHMKMSF